MSFLQYITNTGKNRPENRAIRQLYKTKALINLKVPKSQPKEDSDHPINPIKTKADLSSNSSPNPNNRQGSLSFRKSTELLRPKKNSNPARYGYITRRHHEMEVTQLGAKMNQGELMRQGHDSFSSYLLKNKQIHGSSNPRIRGKLKYYDLDEIANQLAAPKRLSSKLETEESRISNMKNKLGNFQNYQNFLHDVEMDKARYYHDGHTKTNPSYFDSFLDLKGRRQNIRPRNLWRDKIQGQSRAQENIIPWGQNEEIHSPLIPRGKSAFEHQMIDFVELPS